MGAARLLVTRESPHTKKLLQELETFKEKMTEALNETYELWR